uniref:40S ribosomal protein S25 n=1 Tax=Timema monikensis TaxID=170555 RepID=A0A7R9E0B0_9NEOP|nr:unnamed protein product [Timema monikensis]
MLPRQPPKKDSKGSSSKQPQKTQKKKEGGSGGKAKKKKWSKGKVRDKLNNQVLFDKATYEKLLKEVPSYKLITPSVVSERLKVRGSLARRALDELLQKGKLSFIEAGKVTTKWPTREDKEVDSQLLDTKKRCVPSDRHELDHVIDNQPVDKMKTIIWKAGWVKWPARFGPTARQAHV